MEPQRGTARWQARRYLLTLSLRHAADPGVKKTEIMDELAEMYRRGRRDMSRAAGRKPKTKGAAHE